MTGELTVVPALPALRPGFVVPALFGNAGPRAVEMVAEWLKATVRNPNTRASYVRAAQRFSDWCVKEGLRLGNLRPVHAGQYIDYLCETVDERTKKKLAAPTVKQHLAGLRMLGNYLVTKQVIEANPFGPVRGPAYVVKKGKTLALTAGQMRQLLASFDMTLDIEGRIVAKAVEKFTLAELRDRALIAVMAYSFARVSAVLGMDVGDYYSDGVGGRLRLHEKGGKEHDVPCHSVARGYLDAYIAAACLAVDRSGPLFRRINGRRQLTDERLDRRQALAMVKRRAVAAGLSDRVCNHSFRAAGITVYLQNGGTVEKAQTIAAHESPRTTKLYDRREEKIMEEEIERVRF
jgi:integrase/recombinase XerD